MLIYTQLVPAWAAAHACYSSRDTASSRARSACDATITMPPRVRWSRMAASVSATFLCRARRVSSQA
jgi:hypothetical protein